MSANWKVKMAECSEWKREKNRLIHLGKEKNWLVCYLCFRHQQGMQLCNKI